MLRLLAFLLLCMALLIGLSPPVQAQNSNPVRTVMQNAAVATGNGTAAVVEGYATLGLRVTISNTATVTMETNGNGTDWVGLLCTNATDGTVATTILASGVYQCSVAGHTMARARVSSYTAGTVTVNGLATIASGGSGAGGGGGPAATLAGCWATVANPTYIEGTLNALSCTLSGLLRVAVNEFNVLISGEDQPNNLLMTSGGLMRITSFGAVTSATSSAVTTIFTGPVRFMGQITNATSETKAVTVGIYGNWTSSTTGGILICTITLPSTATVTHLEDTCPITAPEFSFYFYTVSVYTSASAAPFTLYAMQ